VLITDAAEPYKGFPTPGIPHSVALFQEHEIPSKAIQETNTMADKPWFLNPKWIYTPALSIIFYKPK